MAYKIRIKHNCPGKILPLTLVYNDSSREFPEIPINMTNEFQTVSLESWELTPDEMDTSKIDIKEQNVPEKYAIYTIKGRYFNEEPQEP